MPHPTDTTLETMPKELGQAGDMSSAMASWIEANWDPSITAREWWRRLAVAGFAMPGRPTEVGGLGLSRDETTSIRRSLLDAGCMGPPGGIGMMLAAPTILAHGTPEQIGRYVEPILHGTVGWCQLFSEPEAGSDLANIQTRAVRDGDDWIISGQKVWTSGGHLSEMGMLLARTDPDASAHHGISWFAFEMDQPGVDIRPLREMTGEAVFNEVFIDEARVPNDALIGPLHGGWRVTMTTLSVERSTLGSAKIDLPAALPGAIPGRLDQPVGVVLADDKSGDDILTVPHLGENELDRWIELARSRGVHTNPVVRQGLTRLTSLVSINRWTAQRFADVPGAENLAKLAMSELFRSFREVGCAILGAEALLACDSVDPGWNVADLTLYSPAPSIYGGTDQIQRNIIGERALGLPREPR